MNRPGQRWVVMIGIMVIAVGCATSGTDTATTPQEESVESAVRELLALTEVANEQIAATQTVEAAVNNAISQTLAVESALTKQAVMATTSYESTATVEGAKLARITEIFESTGTAEAVQMARATANFESTGTAQAIEATANYESTATAEAVLQIIERARTFTATRNADWQPFNHVFRDGVERVLVPVGCFMMGSNDGYDDEKPLHEQCVTEPFWLDKYEVTNALYGSVGCSPTSSATDQPRNCVDWYDAQAFCEARGGTLPSEMQWEYAARGVESWEYPWGNTYAAERVIGEDDPTYGDNRTARVGSRPDGASWVGAMDMSGNVWEWTSTAYLDYPYTQQDEQTNNRDLTRVVRGGSFDDPAINLRSAFRDDWGSTFSYLFIGFRCAFSLNNSGL